MSDKAFITPRILKWARESAKMSVEVAAAKVPVAPERLIEWEDGTSQPTIKQVESLAKAYKRSLAIFFLPDIPYDFQPLQDFRRKTAKELSTASVFIIREIQQKQVWMKELFQENEEPALPFVGKFNLKSDPQIVANDILKTLDIDPRHYSTNNPIKEWIDKAERKGIFVSRTSFIHSRLKLDSEELQGFAIADKYAPFVFINSEDWDAPQLFTLVHEIVHVWIAESGISNDIQPDFKNRDKRHPVELFCNEVAAHALMPDSLIKHVNAGVFESSKEIYKFCRKIGVSSFAFLLRVLAFGLITPDQYKKLKKQADKDFQEFLIAEEQQKAAKKELKGRPDYYLLLVNRNSNLFTRVVMDAFRGGFIEPTQASSLLNTQVNKFSKIEAFLYK